MSYTIDQYVSNPEYLFNVIYQCTFTPVNWQQCIDSTQFRTWSYGIGGTMAAAGVVKQFLINVSLFANFDLPPTDKEDDGVRRVTFGVVGSQLRQKDLAPRSTGAMALFEQALQKWGYDAEARDDAILLRESTGLFVAKFSLADELADLLKAAKETDAGRAVEALLYAASRAEGRALTWPLPSDAHSRLEGDAEACALTMRGWLLVDVAVSKCLYTFAREVDRRSAYRWGHDWRIVDVGGAVFDNDDGALLDGLVAEDE